MSSWKTPGLGQLLLVPLVAMACGGSGGKSTGDGGPTGAGGQTGAGGRDGGNSPTTTETLTLSAKPNNEVDILFVVNDWASTSAIQQKLDDQLPAFVNVLKSGPLSLDLHVAVTTADMGAPGDAASVAGCTVQGDGGRFRSTSTGTVMATCTNTLASGATYLADDGNGNTNFTGSLAGALQCIALVGNSGCGFGQPLAAAARALGADDLQQGTPNPPTTNAGFLRPEAYLAIVLVVNRDDCSPPANTELFSLQGQPDNLANPLGPLNYYRCNQFGHLCTDPASANPTAPISPPLVPPGDAQGSAAAPTLDLQGCSDDDTATGLLTPVSDFVSQIKALKADPDSQILVATLTAPASPYTVAWIPPIGGENTQPGELWPQMELSCGPAGGDQTNPLATQFTTDGTIGEPGVRVSQFTHAFSDSVLASVCDRDYASAMQETATKIAQLPGGQDCVTGAIQQTDAGLPNCTVTAQVLQGTTNTTVSYPNCASNGNAAPCWTLNAGAGSCAGQSLSVMDAPGAPSSSVTATCSVCNGAGVAPGC